MKHHGLALIFLAAVAAGYGGWFFLKADPHHNALLARELATRGLAEHLAHTQPGKRALIMSNPFTQRNSLARQIVETEEAGLRGLRQGFGAKVVSTVAFPDLKPEAWNDPRAVAIDAETTTPLSFLVASNAFDKLAKQHPECDLIVSLIGLPADLSRCEIWNAQGPPKFALLLPDLRMVGDAAAVQSAVKSGKLAAFVLRRPGGPDDAAAPGNDWQAEFGKRFILVTAENVEQVTRAHPELF